jgi:hypothetical protein
MPDVFLLAQVFFFLKRKSVVSTIYFFLLFCLCVLCGESYGANRRLSRGKSTTSLMFSISSMHISNLSMPSPQPACGGIPNRKVSR